MNRIYLASAICTILQFGWILDAAAKEPTMEQTQSYILKQAFPSSIVYVRAYREFDEPGGYLNDRVFYEFKNTKFSNCILTSEVKERSFVSRDLDSEPQDKTLSYNVTLDFSKIEKISDEFKRNVYGDNYFAHNYSFESSKENYYIPIRIVVQPEPNSQLTKAFQHMRKLCNAPEPLKF